MKVRAALVLSLLALAGAPACASEDPDPPTPSPVGWGPGGEPGTPVDEVSGGATGAACVPTSEQSPDYAGAAVEEISLDFGDHCESGICLINHFQGRVSCPYGQNETNIAQLPTSDPTRCRVPDTAGAATEDAVTVPVLPQLFSRTAALTVSCSCRCAGTDSAAEYCTCPQGMECRELFAATGDPARDIYAGSYCVTAASAYDAAAGPGKPCIAGDPEAVLVCGAANP